MAPAIRGKKKTPGPIKTSVPKGINRKKVVAKPPPKRTSQGLYHKPKNKDARNNWKRYRGQGPRQ